MYTNEALGKALEDLTSAYNNFIQKGVDASIAELTPTVLAEIEQKSKDYMADSLASEKQALATAIEQAKIAIQSYINEGSNDFAKTVSTANEALNDLGLALQKSLSDIKTDLKTELETLQAEIIQNLTDKKNQALQSLLDKDAEIKQSLQDYTNLLKADIQKAIRDEAIRASGHIGEIRYFTSKQDTYGFLYANGAPFDPVEYPEYFDFWKANFADETKPNYLGYNADGLPVLPDLRGCALRAIDDGANKCGQEYALEFQDDAIRNITGSIPWVASDAWAPSGESELFKALNREGDNADGGKNNCNGFDFDASRVVPTAEDNRVKSYGVVPFIKII